MKNLLYIIIIAVLMASCKDQDDIYKDYRVPNGTTYPGKPASPTFRSGDGRAEISWLRGSDPSIAYTRIYWNNYTESIQVENPENSDTVRYIIAPLDEGNYAFNIRAYNSQGVASVPVELIGKVYGDTYRASLFNRSAKAILYTPETNTLSIEWVGKAENEVKCMLEYVNTEGQTTQQSVSLDAPTTVINDFKQGLRINSLFVPPLSIDTFHNEPSTPKITQPVLYRQVNTAPVLTGGNNVTATDRGTYAELVKNGFDPFIYTAPLTEALNLPNYYKVYFYIEYQASREINDAQLFYCRPEAAGGVSTAEELHFDNTGLDADDESKWAVFKFDCTTAINNFQWGAVGHRFRYDFVASDSPLAATVFVRKMWYEIYTLQEVDL